MSEILERSGEWGRTWQMMKADDEISIIIWANGPATIATYESASADTQGTVAELLPGELKSLRDWLNEFRAQSPGFSRGEDVNASTT